MTLYHFGNCLLLLYAPYHMAYKYSGVAEYGSLSRCLHAAGLYLFTQLCKMLLLATFFPDTDSGIGEYNFLLEFLKASVDYLDLVGLHAAVHAAPGKSHAKIVTAALGWAGAEVVSREGLGLWSGARGAQFSWRHARAAGGGSVALLGHCGTAALLWLWGRRQPGGPKAPAALLALTPYWPLLEAQLSPGEAGGLLLRALRSAGVSLAALTLHAAHHAH